VTPVQFQNLGTLINAQYSMTVANSILALPYVGSAKLSEFKTQLNLLKIYKMDTSSYQKLYEADLTAMKKASSIGDYLSVSSKINADIAAMHDDLVQGAATYLVGIWTSKRMHGEMRTCITISSTVKTIFWMRAIH
jgi:hypothetical protein